MIFEENGGYLKWKEDIWRKWRIFEEKGGIWRKERVFEENGGYLKGKDDIRRKWRVFEENGGYLKWKEGIWIKWRNIWRKWGVIEEKVGYLKIRRVFEEKWGHLKNMEGIWEWHEKFETNMKDLAWLRKVFKEKKRKNWMKETVFIFEMKGRCDEKGRNSSSYVILRKWGFLKMY